MGLNYKQKSKSYKKHTLMHNKFNICKLTIVGFSLAFASCTKDGSTGPAGPAGPTGPAGPSYVGAIDGHVTLFDQYGSRVLTGLQNVTLSLNGTSVPVDSTGYYRKGSVSTGTFYITASNSGYGSTRINSFQFLSDTLNRDVRMSAIPNFSPSAFTVTPQTGADSLAIGFPTDTRVRTCIIFLNKGATAGSTPDKYLLVYTRNIPANSNRPVPLVIPAQDLINAGFSSGQTVYATAYGYVVNDASVYEDLTTGKGVYTAVSIAPMTVTFTAP